MGIHPPRLPDPTAPETVGHSRRGFLTRVAVGGAALAVGSQVVPVGGLLPLGAQEEDAVELSEDELTVQHLASLALAAADTHKAAATSEGVPEAIVEVIETFGGHNRRQAAALNALIPADALVEVANETLLQETTAGLAGASGGPAVLGVLLEMTERLAATQQAALESLEDQNDARVVATTLGTLSQQAVVLGQLAGEPVEAVVPAVQGTEGAYTADSHPVTVAEEDAPAEDAPAEGGSTTTLGETDESTTTTTEG